MKLNNFINSVILIVIIFLLKMSYYLVFDTETNGLPIRNKKDFTNKGNDFSNVYLYQIAYYKYDKDLNEYSRLNLYINLDDYSVFNYIDKNKITEEILKTKGKKINIVLDFLNKVLDDVCLLVAHNLSFDISVLLTECVRHNKHELYYKLLSIPKFDTMRYASKTALKIVDHIMPSQEKTYNAIFKTNYAPRRRFYCSQFVRACLASFGISNSKELPKIIKPIDFLKLKNKRVVYRGILQNYNVIGG